MDRASLLFCAIALGLSILVGAIALPFASISPDKLARARSVVPAASLGTIDLGGYGKVSVADLVTYYSENPPARKQAGATEPSKVRFEGC